MQRGMGSVGHHCAGFCITFLKELLHTAMFKAIQVVARRVSAADFRIKMTISSRDEMTSYCSRNEIHGSGSMNEVCIG